MQGALINLDIARSGRIDEAGRAEVLGLANEQLQRMAASLSAVRALADAEFADQSWFDEVDLADVADAAVADERRRAPDATVEIESTPPTTVIAWRDGVTLAIANIVRNALVHGVPVDGQVPRVVVSVAGTTVTVDDNGPGVPAGGSSACVLERFERGGGHGSGLGLAIAQQVALAHGGSVTIERESIWRGAPRADIGPAGSVVLVVLPAEVGDLLLAHHPAQGVLQLGELDEEVVLGVEARRNHRRLVVEAQPLLDAAQAGALGEIAEQHQVEGQRRGEDRVAAEEVDLQLHRVAEPAEDVDVVPTLLVVAARRVVVDAHLVVHVAVQLG